MTAAKQRKNSEHAVLMINILWQIWKSINDLIFRANRKDISNISARAVVEWAKYQKIAE